MNSKNHKSARSAAKHSGNGKKKRFVRSRAGVDWMFRRLKHQLALFLMGGNMAGRRKLLADLQRVKTYHALRAHAKAVAGPSKWDRFLDQFYAHRIMTRR